MAPLKKKKSREEILARKRELERLRYQKIKNDPVSRAIQAEKEREKYKVKRQKKQVKLVKEMTSREIRVKRKQWRANSNAYLLGKKNFKKGVDFMISNSPRSTDFESPQPLQQQYRPSPQYIRGRKKVNRSKAKVYKDNAKLRKENMLLKRQYERLRKRIYREKCSQKSDSPKSKVKQYLKTGNKGEIKKKLIFHEALELTLKKSVFEMKRKFRQRFYGLLLNNCKILRKYRLMNGLKFLSNKIFQHSVVTNNNQLRQRIKIVKQCVKSDIENFFIDDEISRCCPGKKDTITRKKIKKQKRVLNDNLKNLYSMFCSRFTNYKLSYATFCRLKPFWVVHQNLKTRDTCACKRHANMSFIIETLSKQNAIKEQDINAVLQTLCCDPFSPRCLFRKCQNCKEKCILYNIFDGSARANFFQWALEKDNYVDKKGIVKKVTHYVKKKNVSTLYNLVQQFEKDIPEFLEHEGRCRHQYSAVKHLKRNLTSDEVLIHCDFSENYTMKYATEIQAFHFGGSRQQYTLHTVVVYYKKDEYATVTQQSLCTLSGHLDHGPAAVWAHLSPVLDYIKTFLPAVTKIHFLTDSPSTQYRNKTIFFLLNRALKEHITNLKLSTWNYMEAGHGKGAPDGIGGCLKRTADRVVSQGKDISCLEDFVDILKTRTRNIKICVIDAEEIEKMKICIPLALKSFKGTMKVHQVVLVSTAPTELQMNSLSCFECHGCDKFKLGKMSFPSDVSYHGEIEVTDYLYDDTNDDASAETIAALTLPYQTESACDMNLRDTAYESTEKVTALKENNNANKERAGDINLEDAAYESTEKVTALKENDDANKERAGDMNSKDAAYESTEKVTALKENNDANKELAGVMNSKDATYESTEKVTALKENYYSNKEFNTPSPFLHNAVLNLNDYVLVKFIPKQKIYYYIGKVVKKYSAEDYDIQFMRRKSNYFVFPEVLDISSIQSREIISKLPSPMIIRNRFFFPVDLTKFNIP